MELFDRLKDGIKGKLIDVIDDAREKVKYVSGCIEERLTGRPSEECD